MKEAGGVVTDLDGKDLDFSQGSTLSANRGILASCNETVHGQLLRGISLLEQ